MQESAGVQPGQHLPFANEITFFDQDICNSLRSIEWNRRLAEVDVAIEGKRSVRCWAVEMPPRAAGSGSQGQKYGNKYPGFRGHGITMAPTQCYVKS